MDGEQTPIPATEADFGESDWFREQFSEAISRTEDLRSEDSDEWTCFLCSRVDDMFEFEYNMCDQCFATHFNRWATLFNRALS